jgi:hypothetical protein
MMPMRPACTKWAFYGRLRYGGRGLLMNMTSCKHISSYNVLVEQHIHITSFLSHSYFEGSDIQTKQSMSKLLIC